MRPSVDAITEGVPEYEVAIAGSNAMIREIARTFPHAELRDTWVWFQSGINTDGAHNWATSRQVQRGDILSLNCFPMIAGYYTALERTLFCGRALRRASPAMGDQRQGAPPRTGADPARRGVQGHRAPNSTRSTTPKACSPTAPSATGTPSACCRHYYGREAGLELREDIDTVLEPGMVVSMEPMIMIPEGQPGAGGYREHDILVVGENSAENITKFPFGPEHNILGAPERRVARTGRSP